MVRLTDTPSETPPDTVLAVVSVYDTDIQSSWGILVLFGVIIALIGMVLLIGSGASRMFTTPETVNA